MAGDEDRVHTKYGNMKAPSFDWCLPES